MDGIVLLGVAVTVLLLPRATRLTPAQDIAWCRRITAGGVAFLLLITLT